MRPFGCVFPQRLAAEILFFRKQLALFQERRIKPHRADDATRWLMVTVSRLFDWRMLLVVVKPDTFIRWHRKGFRLFWRWKSKSTGRPRLPKDLREVDPTDGRSESVWGQERIANELKLKLGIRASPRHRRELPKRRSRLEARSESALQAEGPRFEPASAHHYNQ